MDHIQAEITKNTSLEKNRPGTDQQTTPQKTAKIGLMKRLKSFNKKLASLQLAVIIIIALAILTASGTIIESRYDAFTAKKLVYDTFWMYGVMIVLAINLTAVMIDRWPWKKRHVAFVLAHIGILILLLGSFLTQKYGLDGTLRITVNKENREVVLPEAELQVWASFNGDTYTRINHSEVDFFTKRPSESQPFVLTIAPPDDLKVTNYKPYVIPKREVKESNFATAGSALRFHFENSAAKSVEWLVQRNPTINAEFAMGPLKMILGKAPEYKDSPRPTHEVVFTPLLNKDNQPSGKIRVSIFSKGKNEPLSISESEEGGVVKLPWMNAQVRLLRFLPRAEEEWQISELERPTSVSTSAIEVQFKGNRKWILLDDVVKFFSTDSVYLISYIHRRIPIHFPITLKKFEMAKYQGTQRAMSYQSTVDVPTLGERVISMNEPLKHEGLTFYQASYEQDPNTGQPIASILSVNHDPGRFLKYLGSLIMSLGIVFLFYFKSMDFKFKKGNLNDK